MKVLPLVAGLVASVALAAAQQVHVGTIDDSPQPNDLNGSNFTYPFPVRLYRFSSQRLDLEMAFMDVSPHAGCARRDTLASVDSNTSGPGLSSSLRTTHPRCYFGDSSHDVQQVMAITQNAGGYAILVSLPPLFLLYTTKVDGVPLGKTHQDPATGQTRVVHTLYSGGPERLHHD